MSGDIPDACDIEIVERRRGAQEWPPAHGVIVPNEIRINGKPVLASADHPVTVHEIESRPGEPLLVTLTLYARRVTLGAEEDA